MAPTAPEYNSSFENDGRKRVPKACDRCRLKKVKCDGNMPCPRCKMEDAVCHFGARRKSMERPISAGYVDQLELQQKILIKALKATWRLYGPEQAAANDPSVHDIVRDLGVLEDSPGYQPISPNFRFNERLSSPSLTIGTEITPPPSDGDRRASVISSASSYEPLVKRESFGSSNDSMIQTPPSPAQSIASSHTSIASSSTISTSAIKTQPSDPTSAHMAPLREHRSNRAQPPSFCPLPPRPNFAPTVPTAMDWRENSAFADTTVPPSEGTWLAPPNNWMNTNNINGAMMAMAPPDFDQGLEGLGQLGDESWNAWIHDHPEYGPYRSNLLFGFCSFRMVVDHVDTLLLSCDSLLHILLRVSHAWKTRENIANIYISARTVPTPDYFQPEPVLRRLTTTMCAAAGQLPSAATITGRSTTARSRNGQTQN